MGTQQSTLRAKKLAILKARNAEVKRLRAASIEEIHRWTTGEKKSKTRRIIRPRRRPPDWAKYLHMLAAGFTYGAAMEVSRVYKRILTQKRKDPEFAEAEKHAYEHGTDTLEQVAVKRAKKKSDPLMMFLLKSRNRQRFSERHVMTGEGGGPLIAFLQSLPDE